jgi:HlyD family secretion protein
MKTSTKNSFYTGLLFLAGIVGVAFFSHYKNTVNAKEVTVQEVSLRTIATKVRVRGQVTAWHQVDLSPNVAGSIDHIFISEGDKVKKGDVLAQIDNESYQTLVEQAKLSIDEINNEIKQAEVAFIQAARDLRRKKKLQLNQQVSKSVLDEATDHHTKVRLQLERRKISLKRANSELRKAQDDLAQTIIKAPMDGTILSVFMRVGEVAVPSATNIPGSKIISMGDTDRIAVTISVNEYDINKVVVGQIANINLPAMPKTEYNGKVVEIDSLGSKNETRGIVLYDVKVLLDSHSSNIRPGMTADVDLIVDIKRHVPTVAIHAIQQKTPTDSLKEDHDTSRVKQQANVVYLPVDGVAKSQSVSLGVSDELYTEITSGLTVGQEVIVGPFRKLKYMRDGDLIVITKKLGLQQIKNEMISMSNR